MGTSCGVLGFRDTNATEEGKAFVVFSLENKACFMKILLHKFQLARHDGPGLLASRMGGALACQVPTPSHPQPPQPATDNSGTYVAKQHPPLGTLVTSSAKWWSWRSCLHCSSAANLPLFQQTWVPQGPHTKVALYSTCLCPLPNSERGEQADCDTPTCEKSWATCDREVEGEGGPLTYLTVFWGFSHTRKRPRRLYLPRVVLWLVLVELDARRPRHQAPPNRGFNLLVSKPCPPPPWQQREAPTPSQAPTPSPCSQPCKFGIGILQHISRVILL